MSRNVRQKHPATPVKASKRRGSDSSSSLDLSDSDGYSAVGAISDSDEDDEEDVIAAEEEHLVTNLLHGSTHSSPRPVHEEDDEGDDEDDDAEDEEEEDEDDEEEDDEDDDDDDEVIEDAGSWEGFMSEGHEHESDATTQAVSVGSVERRVRFDVPDSDGDTTEDDEGIEDFFPDIFVDQNSLDPSFRREIEDDDPDNSSDSGSFWDLHGNNESDILYDLTASDADTAAILAAIEDDDSTPVATPMTSNDLTTAASTPAASPDADELSLDGYQSDGDTTDDEDPPPRPIRRKTSRDGASRAAELEAAALMRPRRGKPRVGRFNLDSNGQKPVAVVNPRTGKLMIFTPQKLRRLDLSPETFNFPFFEPVSQSSPILSNSGNLMMGAMFSSNTFGDFMNTQAVGPVEAFFSTSPGGNILDDISEEDIVEEDDDDEEDEGESGLNLDDFLTLEESSDEDDDNIPDEHDLYSTTPGRPTTASSDVASLLSHLEHNSDIVGAFRRDQANSQLLRSGKATRESLAFSGPFFQGTLRGIKDGRISSTNVPISPLRKQKRRGPDLTSSPLAGMSQKRKSSAQQQFGHKRQRSIPDVDLLSIQ
ncbi:hypothetical protein BX600DRAFT_442045 [Xylariales sp. PMI_506]|nr:hypothetical protein BX600DRAFT_442045 [Xylariales sp. PMI_506]